MSKRILIVTANEHETQAILGDRNFFEYEEKRSSLNSDANFYHVGKFGCYNAVHFELIDQGTIKADSSILSIYDAIEAWQPDAVILFGIAFGKDNEEMPDPRQHIGDVLISKMVADYESGKIKNGIQQSDGSNPESGRHLVSAFQNYKKTWHYSINGREAEAVIGLMLSGDKVVDDKEFKSYLFANYPRAIGGEMEGRGAYSACRRKGIDEWIIVKAICDWGENKGSNKRENQITASESAASFLRHVFSKPEAFDKLPSKQDPNSRSGEHKQGNTNKPSGQGLMQVCGNSADTIIATQGSVIYGGINFGGKQ